METRRMKIVELKNKLEDDRKEILNSEIQEGSEFQSKNNNTWKILKKKENQIRCICFYKSLLGSGVFMIENNQFLVFLSNFFQRYKNVSTIMKEVTKEDIIDFFKNNTEFSIMKETETKIDITCNEGILRGIKDNELNLILNIEKS